jgi:WD40 repeat protein/tetratricopeptide (TPR) repeat protein
VRAFPHSSFARSGCVNTLHWSQSGDILISGSDDCRVCLWSVAGPERTSLSVALVTGHRRNIFSAVFVPETTNTKVVTCALDRQVRYLDVTTGTHQHLTTCRQFCSKVVFVPGTPHCFLTSGQDVSAASHSSFSTQARLSLCLSPLPSSLFPLPSPLSPLYLPSPLSTSTSTSTSADDPLGHLPVGVCAAQGKVSLFDLRVKSAEGLPAQPIVDLSSIGGCTALAFDPTSSGVHFSVGCDDPLVRTYDMRKLCTEDAEATRPIFQYAPRELLGSVTGGRTLYRRMASGASGLAYSATGELLVNMRGADVYRFETMSAALGRTPTATAPSSTSPTSPPPATASSAAKRRRPSDDGDNTARGEDEGEGAALAPMDDAVRTFERSRRSLGRPSASVAPAAEADSVVESISGVPTLGCALRTYVGRENDETFAKEVCFLHDDTYVATGGDCGRVYLWAVESGRLVYREKGDSNIVNCVAPHPSLPILAVSGIDDDVKLFGLGDPRPSSLKRNAAGYVMHGRRPHRRGGTAPSDGWAMDNDGPPPRCVAAAEAAEALAEASRLREAGNAAFRAGDMELAVRVYEEGCDALHVEPPGEAQREELAGERLRMWLNLAAGLLKLSQPTAAAVWCERVLAVRPSDVKALYRLAHAHLSLGQLEKAEEGLRRAREIEPGEPALARLEQTLDRAREMQRQMAWEDDEEEDEEDDDEEDEEGEDDDEEDDDDDDDDDDDEDEEDDDEEEDEAEDEAGEQSDEDDKHSDDEDLGRDDDDVDDEIGDSDELYLDAHEEDPGEHDDAPE